MLFLGNFGRAILLSGIIFLLSGAQAMAGNCAAFPRVSWWKGLTHQSVERYVRIRHNGDWKSYIDKWEKQYTKIKAIYDKNEAIIIPRDKIKVKGEDLKTYIGQIRDRINVTRCLAEAARTAGKAGVNGQAKPARQPKRAVAVTRPVTRPVTGDRAAGKKIAVRAGCGECHGREGISLRPDVPNLAGQKKIYLESRLAGFLIDPPKGIPVESYVARHIYPTMAKKRKFRTAEIGLLAKYYASLKRN